MASPKLYMLLLGCRPKGRNTEQHDIFFTIAESMSDWVKPMKEFWPEAKSDIHIDAWREVTHVDGYEIKVVPHEEAENSANDKTRSLFFINLGGYKAEDFEEFHYKVLTVSQTLDEAKLSSKKTAFFKHVGIKGAPSHIDDKYGVDTDDAHDVKDILPATFKERYCIQIVATDTWQQDELHLGYLPLFKIPK